MSEVEKSKVQISQVTYVLVCHPFPTGRRRWNWRWILLGGGAGLGLREWGLIFHCLHLCVIFFTMCIYDLYQN